LELYDGTSGTVLAEDDDGGEDYNARIEYEVEAGKSYLAKLGAYEEETGSYQIRATLEAIPQDAYEPNNTQQQAANLTPGRTVSAIIQSQSDLDWFKLTAPAGNPLLVAYTEGNLDTTVTVYNAQGAELADDDDSGDGENARVAVSVPQGTVYIRVSGYGSSYGNYSLTAQFVEVKPDLYENDDTAPRAKEITVGTPQERSFTTASDVDWAKFIIRQAGAYAIRAVGADESLDTYLELYSFEQDALDEDDDGGDDLDALMRTRLDPGTYLIKVSTLNDGPLEDNRYTLSVRRE
jgi:hypothetical protein